jgi:hypothetical protein
MHGDGNVIKPTVAAWTSTFTVLPLSNGHNGPRFGMPQYYYAATPAGGRQLLDRFVGKAALRCVRTPRSLMMY